MILWTDEVHRFETPFGEVAVNGTADRWCLHRINPEAMNLAVEDALSAPGVHPTDEWVALCRAVPLGDQAQDAREWLDAMLRTPTGTGKNIFSRPIRLLASLRLKGVLLWPAAAHLLPHPCDPGRVLLLPDGKTAYEHGLLNSLPNPPSCVGTMLMSCSPMNSVDEVHEPALLAALTVIVESKHSRILRKGGTILALFRGLDGARRGDGSTVEILDKAHGMLHRDRLVGRDASRFGKACGSPDAGRWLVWFELASDHARLKTGHKQDRSFGDWLEYLASLGQIPMPAEVTREAHVLGIAGFLSWLGLRVDPACAHYAKKLIYLQGLFTLIVEKGAMSSVPIHDGDIPQQSPANNKSNKAVLPREIMEMARDVVRELVAAAFNQYEELANQSWRPAGSLLPSSFALLSQAEMFPLPETLLKRDSFSHLLVTLRSADGAVVRVINPILPAALLWLLRMPNRGIEILLMDSGEADEELPHIAVNTGVDGRERVVADWRPNPHPLATPGRRAGVIREVGDPEFSRQVVGFYVNTNKSQPGGHADGADRGRTIPWEDPEMLTAFYKVRVWQERLNPADRLRARDELRDSRYRTSNGLRGKLPGYCYLFRHLKDADLGGRHEPPSHNELLAMLRTVLDEVEARLSARPLGRQAHDQRGDGRRPYRIVTERRANKRPMRCAYSLHSLRVTGITAMMEAGVPLWIISEVVAGHQSWVMTLYYYKASPTRIMDALAAARERAADGSLDREVMEAASLSLADLERRFVSDDEVATALQGAQITGFWLPMIDGICSNGATLCHEGGPFVEGSGRHGPVEGGARNCGLCRFFLTGPCFLAGQVVMVNGFLHKARRQAKGLQKLWKQLRVESDPARRARVEDRIKRAEETIDLTLRTVNARVRLLWKSRALAAMTEEGREDTEESGALLITRLDEDEVVASLRAASDLGFLDEASRVAALVPELDIQDAPIERNAFVDKLLEDNGFEGMLYRLPPAAAQAAGDAFTDALRSLAPPGASPHAFLDAVAENRIRLLDPDVSAITDEMSRALGERIEIRRRLAVASVPPPAMLGQTDPLT